MGGADGQVVTETLLAYEGMGVMDYRDDISIEWIDELFHFEIVDSWRKEKVLAAIACRKGWMSALQRCRRPTRPTATASGSRRANRCSAEAYRPAIAGNIAAGRSKSSC